MPTDEWPDMTKLTPPSAAEGTTMSDSDKPAEATQPAAEAPAEPTTEKPPMLYFRVEFRDLVKEDIHVDTNFSNVRTLLDKLGPVIEHLRRQGTIEEIGDQQRAALKQMQLNQQVNQVRRHLAGKGARIG